MHTLHPITRSGGYVLEGGYRQRTEWCVRELEARLTGLRQEIQRVDALRASGADAVYPRELLEECRFFADATVLFAAVAIESFVNFYGTVRLGEKFNSKHFERQGALQKLAAVLATCLGQLVSADDEIASTMLRVYEHRNRLVHPKTREFKAEKEWPPRDSRFSNARECVRDMERFFDLFLELDPDARSYARL